MNSKCPHHAKGSAHSQQHDFGAWFHKFASYLRTAPLGNPFSRLLQRDRNCNPFFISFVLYWFLLPGESLIEKARDQALQMLKRVRKARRRLTHDADILREIAEFRFSPPFGRQLRELRVRRTPKSSAAELERIAALCKKAVADLEPRENILKELTSGKRKPRNTCVVMLWMHMTTKVGKGLAGSLLYTLIDCADQAFGNLSQPHRAETYELACKRYQKLFPEDFRRRGAEAKHNRQRMPPNVREMWMRLGDSDTKAIVEYIRPRFEREVSRIQKK